MESADVFSFKIRFAVNSSRSKVREKLTSLSSDVGGFVSFVGTSNFTLFISHLEYDHEVFRKIQGIQWDEVMLEEAIVFAEEELWLHFKNDGIYERRRHFKKNKGPSEIRQSVEKQIWQFIEKCLQQKD